MTGPTYRHAMDLAQERAYEWSRTLDCIDFDDAIWEWTFRKHLNARRHRKGIEPLHNPKPKREDFEKERDSGGLWR